MSDYGKEMSVMEALEQLAYACLVNGVPVPSKIVFPAGGVDRFSAHLIGIVPRSQVVHSRVKTVCFNSGSIQIEDES
jgi:hypothetical protein